jgi:hypothetical protein
VPSGHRATAASLEKHGSLEQSLTSLPRTKRRKHGSVAEVSLSGKFLLFKSAAANLVLHYSQNKKFDIETLSEIKSPAKQ